MAIIAKNTGTSNSPRKVCPAGSHIARCYGMIEIGTIKNEYLGEVKNQYKVMIDFELPNELEVFKEGEAPQPYVISKEFTLSFHEKATLRAQLSSWRGKPFSDEEAAKFDITKLVGVPAMINVIHKPSADGSKVYANIASISPIPKGMECPPQINPTRVLSYDTWNQDLFMSLPDWLAERISSTPEYKAKFDISSNGAPKLDVIGSKSEEEVLPF